MESPFNGLNYMQTPADEETAKNFDNSAQSSDVIFARTRLMFQPHKTAPRMCFNGKTDKSRAKPFSSSGSSVWEIPSPRLPQLPKARTNKIKNIG